MNDNATQDEIETTARISTEKYHNMIEHEDFDSIRQDADYEAYDSLPEKHKAVINSADENLDGWSPEDRYFELNQDRHGDKIQYLRMDIYGVSDCDFSTVDFSREDLEEAIKEWNGRQLTLQLEEVKEEEK